MLGYWIPTDCSGIGYVAVILLRRVKETDVNIKYPKFSVQGKPCDFYLFYQETEYSYPKNSGWIKGNADLYHKLQKLKRKDLQLKIKEIIENK